MEYLRAGSSHAEAVAGLAALLWSEGDPAELLVDFEQALRGDKHAVFICFDKGVEVGFAEFSLRHDYVEGANMSPTGYVEAIYVREYYRNMGIARNLIKLGETWANERGCTQMASDCELTNTDSMEFHLKCGFTEANRIVCFLKDI